MGYFIFPCHYALRLLMKGIRNCFRKFLAYDKSEFLRSYAKRKAFFDRIYQVKKEGEYRLSFKIFVYIYIQFFLYLYT